MAMWYEFRLWYGANKNPDMLFTFKRTLLLQILEMYALENFLVLDEPDFVLLRVVVDDKSAEQIRSSLEESIHSSTLFSIVSVETWSPIVDAKQRILSAREKANLPAEIPPGGWMIKSNAISGNLIPVKEDLDKQITAFSTFMTRVVGKFTKAYLKEMPYRVEDRWLMSVFLHLILDSISTWQHEEKQIRQFPYL